MAEHELFDAPNDSQLAEPRSKKQKSVKTIKFDVGGQKHRVSKSLFDKYPESMLARSVSEQWLQDPSEEIFIVS